MGQTMLFSLVDLSPVIGQERAKKLVLAAVRQRQSILLFGPKACGKTLMLKQLASGLGGSGVNVRASLSDFRQQLARAGDVVVADDLQLADEKRLDLLAQFVENGGLALCAMRGVPVECELIGHVVPIRLERVSPEAFQSILTREGLDVSEVAEIVYRLTDGDIRLAKGVLRVAVEAGIELTPAGIKELGTVTVTMSKGEKSLAVSAWIKAMRLGLVDEAFYWLGIMMDGGLPVGYIGRRLAVFAGEDAFGPEAWQMGAAFATLADKGAYEGIWAGTYYMCKAEKWWESQEGIAWCFTRNLAEWRSRLDRAEGTVRPPSWACDLHTGHGWDRKKKRLPVDERYSGDWRGRLFTAWEYMVRGELVGGEEWSPQELRVQSERMKPLLWRTFKEMMAEDWSENADALEELLDAPFEDMERHGRFKDGGF